MFKKTSGLVYCGYSKSPFEKDSSKVDSLLNTPSTYLATLSISTIAGYTSKAGLCLASIAKYDNVNYLLVTIGADHENKMQHIEDSKNIYEYFFNNFRYKKILSKKDILVNLKTIYDEKYTILSKENVEVYLNNNIEKNDLEHVYDGEKILDKTVKKSDKIGTYYIKKDNEILYSKQITSPVDVKMPINYFLKHNIVLIILFLLIIILIPISLMNKKKNNFK